jgi:hypothetical protein
MTKTYIIVVDGELDIETLLEQAIIPDEVDCPCGVKFKKANLSHHHKTKRHLMWTGKTDDEIDEIGVQCECGVKCRKKGLKRHMTTALHKRRMELKSS